MLKEEKRKIERQKLINKMKDEIKYLEDKIIESENNNKRNKKIRLLKTILRSIQLVYPYIIAAGISFGAFKMFDVAPFTNNTYEEYLNTMKEIDSLGNIRYEMQYEDYENQKNFITHYSKWEKIDDTQYKRNVTTYNFGDYKEEEILEILKKVPIRVEDCFGSKIIEKTEIKNNISPDELQNDEILQATIYSKSEEEFIVLNFSSEENVGISALFFIILGVCCYFVGEWRKTTKYHFSNKLADIQEKYPNIDVTPYIKSLNIRKENYKKLTGENDV